MDERVRSTLVEAATTLLNYLALQEEPAPADIIWGLGSHEPKVAERAAELHHEGWAPWIVFSGGKGHRWADLTVSEAELFRETAVARGVPPERILVETESTNTAENILRSSELFVARGLEVRTALLVTIPPFQRRAWWTVRTRRPDIRCLNCPSDWGVAESWDDDQLRLIARLCAGEIRRLQEYPRRGFLTGDMPEVPDDLAAVAAGVRAHVPAW